MAFEAEIWIALDQQLPVDRAVRVVTDGATLPQRLVLENDRAGLLAMTPGAGFVLPCHRKSAGPFENVAAVRIVTLHTVHPFFQDRMMLRQAEFGMRLQMTLEAGGGVLAGVDDELAATAAGFDVSAAGAMTGFTAALPRHRCVREMNARVRTGGELADVICVALETRTVADHVRAGNLRRRESCVWQR